MKGNWNVGVGMLLLAGLLAGCESTGMEKRNQRRLENMRGFIDILARNEADRAERLGRTLDELERRPQLDSVRTAENLQKLKSWIGDDFDNWEQKQPVIYRHISNELAGDPANLGSTLLDVLD